MELETIGHAALVLKDDQGAPLLLTDPWLLGSTYWRSWWLQSYPSKETMEELKEVKYVYITHEHMDHYHPPTLRKIGTVPTYLSPALPQEAIADYLGGKGFNTEVVEAFKWRALSTEVSILSIPLPNDDSMLLIDTPTTFIININDSKPMKYQLKRLRKYLDANVVGKKKIIVLSSYSPASVVNSFRKGVDFDVVQIKDKKAYADYVSNTVSFLGADYFFPFASQVIFYRSDSVWANEYKLTYSELKKYWSAPHTELCHPYTKINLETFETSFLPEEEYYRDEEMIQTKVDIQEKKEIGVEFSEQDVEDLRKKLSFSRFWIPILFRKGIGFILDEQKFTYKPWGKKVIKGIENPSFSLMIPPQALKDVLFTGHFADLGITMFTLIILNGKTKPKLVYVFFLLVALHDYKHLWNFKNFWKWFRSSLRFNKWRIPKLNPA